MKILLSVRNLHVCAKNKEILHGIDFDIEAGQNLVIAGRNGTGKSTIARALAGIVPISDGKIIYKNKNISQIKIDERAKMGIFLSYQEPIAIPGLSVSEMLRTALELRGDKISYGNFRLLLAEKLEKLGLSQFFANKELNVDFSGGEKKKLEVLQLLMLRPDLAILDEIDSGLDADAAKHIAKILAEYQKETGAAFIIITHNQRILSELNVDKVLVIKDGSPAKTGNATLLDEIKKHGFAKL